MTEIRPPLRPCGSCPYRLDVPSGIWLPHEYAKLPRYDGTTGEQAARGVAAVAVFMCHQQDGRVCAGWAGCHDMAEALGPRIALLTGELSEDTFEALMAYRSPVPLFASGAEAAAHGLADVDEPGERARTMGRDLMRKRS